MATPQAQLEMLRRFCRHAKRRNDEEGDMHSEAGSPCDLLQRIDDALMEEHARVEVLGRALTSALLNLGARALCSTQFHF